jgi:hypothetical protein
MTICHSEAIARKVEKVTYYSGSLTDAVLSAVSHSTAQFVSVLSADALVAATELLTRLHTLIDAHIDIEKQTTADGPRVLGMSLHAPCAVSEVTGERLRIDSKAAAAYQFPDSYGAVYRGDSIRAFAAWAYSSSLSDPVIPYSLANRWYA